MSEYEKEFNRQGGSFLVCTLFVVVNFFGAIRDACKSQQVENKMIGLNEETKNLDQESKF